MGYGVTMSTICYRHMSAEAHETLSLGRAHGYSLRTVASVLGRAPSSVCRKSTCPASRDRPYRACTAQALATARACLPRRPRKLLNPWLWEYVRTHLVEGCMPEQIAGRLKRVYPNGMGTQLSAETIYGGLYVLPRGTLRSELLTALGQARKARRPRARGTDRGGQISNMTSIAERPRGGHPHRARPLGRRPHQGGQQWVGHRDPGGADNTLGYLGTEGRDGCDECPCGLHQETSACAHAAAQHLDLRSGERDGRARVPGRTARTPGILCRSGQAVPTRHQRDHQGAAASVFTRCI